MTSPQTFAALFHLAALDYQNRQQGRLRGRHCVARLLRAQAKRRKAGKTPYTP